MNGWKDARRSIPPSSMRPLFDAHLDLAWNALSFDRDLTRDVAAVRQREAGLADAPGRGGCTVTLPELRRAGVGVCVATLLARGGPEPRLRRPTHHRTDLDYASPSIAYAVAQGQLAYYRLLERQGHLRLIRTATELAVHWEAWRRDPAAQPLGVVLSMEGADPIVAPEQAADWWRDGLRVVGLAHYGQGQYAHGTGVCGPLGDRGLALLAEMDRLGYALDVTHCCDESMAQALDHFEGPVLASHHNCRALVQGDRQLTDEQIRRLVARDAVVGAALDAWMLYPGWKRGETPRDVVTLDAVAAQIDHVCQLAGDARHAALGTDLDGGFGNEQTPHDLDTAADLQRLAGYLSARGYTDADVDAIFHGNWLRFFGRALPD